MASYELRVRKQKQKQLYMSFSSDSDTGHENDSSVVSDPDYSKIERPRQRCSGPRASNGVVLAENGCFVPRGKRRRRRISNDSIVTEKSESRKGTILSWLIDMKMFEENDEVGYLDQTQNKIMLEGRVTREGIICKCCEKEITVRNFEVHARSNQNKAYENIFIAINNKNKTRMSLFDCQIEALKKMAIINAAELKATYSNCFNMINLPNPLLISTVKDKNDDACLICADGGNLICSENAPLLSISIASNLRIPQGDWLCPSCVCKYCGLSENDHDGGLHPCSQCQKRYHWSCYLRNVGQALDLNGDGSSFCGLNCKFILQSIENILGAKMEHCGDFSWRFLKQKDITQSSNIEDLHRRVNCNSKLAIAWSIMESCFEPIIDRFTQMNIVKNVVFNHGSNFNRVNFEGFYTFILEKAEEIISVACLRIHGTEIAELPFIATQKRYRRKGMCQKLLLVIESALCALNVEKLVIPSAGDVETMWIEKFGFCPIDDFVKKEITNFNTLMFPGAIRLQKILKPHLSTSQDIGDGKSVITTINNREPKWDLNMEPPSDDESLISINKISSH